MFGTPKDIEGQCNEHLYIGDDEGDNSATMRCQLPKGHEGVHQEVFERESSGKVIVTWEHSERCWHEFVSMDSDRALELYLKDYEKEERAREMHKMDAACYKSICVKCGDCEWK